MINVNKMEASRFCCLLSTLTLSIFMVYLTAPADGVHTTPTPIIPQLCKKKAPELEINTALLNIEVDVQLAAKPLVLYLQSSQCYTCDLIPRSRITSNCSISVDSRWPMRVELREESSGSINRLSDSCSERALTMLYKEGANYTIYVDTEITNIVCSVVMNNDSPDPYIPIYVALSIGFLCSVLWIAGKYVYRKGYIHRILCFWSTESMMSDLGTPTNISQVDNASATESKVVVKERLKSLDTFRGIAITIMIFVNYGGGDYWFFKHSKWNGLTVADLVFPWFVFIMGTAMIYSFKGQLQNRIPKWKIFLKILKRSATLFLIGLLINSFGMKNGMEFDTFRIPGVLQRFAGTYLITATVHLFLAPAKNPNQFTRFASIRDIVIYWPEWIVIFILIAVHTSITMCMSVPGCPDGYLGPGGFDHDGSYFNCTGGASGYIDRMFFGSSHIYQTPTSQEIYQSIMPYDPEGLLGTLTSCVLCFLGLQAGKILYIHNDWVKRCKRFFIWTVMLTCLGILLCEGSLNDGWIPINKNLWSLSFIFILSGMAFFLLLVCYLFIDVYKIWSGSPFYYAGMNSIALYCGHEFFSGRAPVSFKVPSTHAAELALNIWGTVFWVLVSVYFYFNNIFISV